jgi:hypothetical protein
VWLERKRWRCPHEHTSPTLEDVRRAGVAVEETLAWHSRSRREIAVKKEKRCMRGSQSNLYKVPIPLALRHHNSTLKQCSSSALLWRICASTPSPSIMLHLEHLYLGTTSQPSLVTSLAYFANQEEEVSFSFSKSLNLPLSSKF